MDIKKERNSKNTDIARNVILFWRNFICAQISFCVQE